MPIAYSYKRFSSEKQARGDSLRRQTELAESYISSNPHLNLILDQERHLTDEGMSAYKGVHLKKGALGVFIRAVEDGQIEEGSYLLVESLDRLSRGQPSDALPQLIDLVKSGIVVVTLNDNRIYSEESISGTNGSFVLMQSLVGMARAFEESETKGKRVRAAWENKFKKIKDGIQLTKRVPFWLNSDRTVRLEKVAIVNRIFNDYVSGKGSKVIATELNNEQVETPTLAAKYWHESTVKKILNSSSVIGTLKTADGQSHEGYYPAVISKELWVEAQLTKGSDTRRRSIINRIMPSAEVNRPLAGLLKCTCGATIVRAAKTGRVRKDGTKNMWELLVCSRARVGGHGCLYKSLSYSKVLKAIKDSIPEASLLASSIDNELEVRGFDEAIFELQMSAQEAYAVLKTTRTPQSRAEYQRISSELEDLQEKRKQLVEAVGTVGSHVMGMLFKEPRMTNEWLRKVFKEGILDTLGESLSLTLQNGKVLEIALNASEEEGVAL